MNVLKLHKQHAIATLLERGVSHREIERVTGIDRKTIRSYAQRSNSPGVATGSDANSPTLATGEVQIPPPRPPAPASACEPYRDWIVVQVQLRRNATAIYQDLVDQFGFAGAYNSVKRFVHRLKTREPEQFDRLEFLPGEEAQVDYGEGALTRHALTGRFRRPRLFVMTLRYSRRCFRRVVWQSSQEVWAELHAQAFSYFGGVPSYVVLDNLKEGVIAPDLYEPHLNRVYAAMLAHYGVVADPARVRDPNRKGAVENAIQHTQGTALKGRRFESLEAQNIFLEHWETHWAAQRIHGSARRQVEAMFQEERPHLKPLPATAFRSFTDLVRTVCDDTTVRIQHSSYAARPATIGSQVLVRLYEHHLEIRELATQTLLRTHPRAQRPGSVLLPDAERPFNPSRETRHILAQAKAIGPAAQALCQGLFDLEGRVGQRRLWGIVNLARQYPHQLVNEACQSALADGIRSYRHVKHLTELAFCQALEAARASATENGTQSHPLIRSTAAYAELFDRGAQFSATLTNPEPNP